MLLELKMRFWSIRTSLAITAATIMALAAGCSSGSAGTAAAGKLEKTHIVVDTFDAIDSAGMWIAQQEGLFAKVGLTVTIVPQRVGTQPMISDQLKGTADISSGDYVTYIHDQLAGTANLRIIAEASFLQPNVLTVLVPPGSKVSSINALKGRTISVNAPNDIGTLLVDSLLQEHGIPRNDVTINSNVPFPLVGTAFQTGKIDAAFAPEPFVSLLAEGGAVQELADLDQGATSNFPIQGFAVTSTWAHNNPNTLKAFVTALRQGQEIADTNRGAVEQALEKNLGLKPAQVALVSLPNFPVTLDPVRLQRVVDDLRQFNLFSGPGFSPAVAQRLQTFKISSIIAG
jgi:NitT/TauT family transport system substrate-binding protein